MKFVGQWAGAGEGDLRIEFSDMKTMNHKSQFDNYISLSLKGSSGAK